MKILVTGSSGLIGSAAVEHFDNLGHDVVGADNNARAAFFGARGDTSWNLARLRSVAARFRHYDLDIRDRAAILALFEAERFDAVINCAAQPSHDLAARVPFDDFEVNATGTLNLLEANRRFSGGAPFLQMSTNKVYGDAPNEIDLIELETRYDYADPNYAHGIPETMRIDRSMHSLFGASKVAADVMVQEYGRYFEMPTVCFRGGCLTGPGHSGVELHGFLNHLVRVALSGERYTIHGYKGKQVRDQIHAADVAALFEHALADPPVAGVFNLGGGRENSASVLESIAIVEATTGRSIDWALSDENRAGDHICYISDLRALRAAFPAWGPTRDLSTMVEEIADSHKEPSS